MIEADRRLQEAARHCTEVFTFHFGELTDLHWSFWFSLGALHGAACFGDAQAVRLVIKYRHRDFGAPGDFGYSTPCGDALRELYDASFATVAELRAFIRARNEAE